MKFLVLGSSGMAGHVIALYLKERGHKVVGFSRRPLTFLNSICGDATDLKLLTTTIRNGSFDVVINAIGVLNNDAEADKARAVFLNSYLPHCLTEITKNSNTRIFQMSTDCIFKGNTGPYTENSFPDGDTFYDRTKALGELNDNKNLTLRCSIVGPDINLQGIGLFNWFMKQTGKVKGYSGAIWTGLTTIELARSMLFAAENNASGLINLVPESNISKFELLQLFNNYFRNSCISIEPDDKLQLDKTLIRTNFNFNFANRSYEEQIKDMRNWVYQHQSLYPHYMY